MYKSITILIFMCAISACSSFKPDALIYEQENVPGKEAPIEYGVYLPPGWEMGERLPLIVFLHGVGGSHLSFEQYGAHEYLDQKINQGKIKRAIIVIPDGDNGMWENWHDGSHHYRDWVLEGIVPKVQKKYQTLKCPEHCHLAGISMGGFGALRFAYYAREQFSSVSAMSAPIFSDQQAGEQSASFLLRLLIPFDEIFDERLSGRYKPSNPYNAWVDDPGLSNVRLQLMWGSEDKENILELNELFHQRLLENNIEHDAYVYQGSHKWKDWIMNFERMMNFLLIEY